MSLEAKNLRMYELLRPSEHRIQAVVVNLCVVVLELHRRYLSKTLDIMRRTFHTHTNATKSGLTKEITHIECAVRRQVVELGIQTRTTQNAPISDNGLWHKAVDVHVLRVVNEVTTSS